MVDGSSGCNEGGMEEWGNSERRGGKYSTEARTEAIITADMRWYRITQ